MCQATVCYKLKVGTVFNTNLLRKTIQSPLGSLYFRSRLYLYPDVTCSSKHGPHASLNVSRRDLFGS
jgi:hypothetical protein